MNILFWNASIGKICKHTEQHKDRIEASLVELIIENKADIVVLAEYEADLLRVCDLLAVDGYLYKEGKTINPKCRVKLLLKDELSYEYYKDPEYYFIVRIVNVVGYEFLLGGVHFPSKLSPAALEGCRRTADDMVRELQDLEKKVVIIGDFNSNPYEEIMLGFDYFHALPYSEVVRRKNSRISYGIERRIFYNPMWNYINDFSNPHGTYYLDSNASICTGYNILDQVLLSANMIDDLENKSIRIITEVNGETLVNDLNRPDKGKYSDHLPIVFTVKGECGIRQNLKKI